MEGSFWQELPIQGKDWIKKMTSKEDQTSGWLESMNSEMNCGKRLLGTASDEEAKAVIQTTDLGVFVAGNVHNSAKGYGSKDAWIIRLDKDGKELSQLIIEKYNIKIYPNPVSDYAYVEIGFDFKEADICCMI